MKYSWILWGVGALIGAPVFAASNQTGPGKPITACPANNQLCFSVSIPPSSAASEQGDIFLQIQAPASYEWAALGQGLEMAGSNIFVIYADAANKNVTLSPRLGVSEIEPLYNGAAQVELMAGSGIANGLMTANIRCANCATWSGGNMTFQNNYTSWIWAYKSGIAIGSSSMTSNLALHDDYGTMIFDLTKAIGGSSTVNPFVTPEGSSTTANGTTPGVNTPADTMASQGSILNTATAAHGIMMSLVMLIFLPVGALMRRVAPRLSIWAHAAVQSISLTAAIAAAGLGVFVARATGNMSAAHSVLGIFVMVLMALQPIWGLLQHRHFRAYRERGRWGSLHRALGWIAMLLGVVNGGLGLELAGTVGSSGGNAYVLAAVALSCTYALTCGSIAFTKRHTSRRRRRKHVSHI